MNWFADVNDTTCGGGKFTGGYGGNVGEKVCVYNNPVLFC